MSSLIDEIRPLILRLQELQEQKLKLLSHEVWLIVEGHQAFSSQQAEYLLDELMDLALFGVGETTFRAFLGYVDALDPELSADYRRIWQEFAEEN